MAWPALWITMFALDHWQIALVLLFMTGPVMALVHGKVDPRRRWRRLARHEEHWRRRASRGHLPRAEDTSAGRLTDHGEVSTPDPQHPAARAPRARASTSAAERSLAATLIRAESSSSRLDDDHLELVRDVEALLRPLLGRVRADDADPLVRHDVEAIATEHLPGALDAYLVLPTDYAHEHRTATGTTPADELRGQLLSLVEGCRQLRDAVHDADVDRQQQLSRYLDAKFRRSDLDL